MIFEEDGEYMNVLPHLTADHRVWSLSSEVFSLMFDETTILA
jgi:hypothetical protein